MHKLLAVLFTLLNPHEETSAFQFILSKTDKSFHRVLCLLRILLRVLFLKFVLVEDIQLELVEAGDEVK
jgi:hypothetical protein